MPKLPLATKLLIYLDAFVVFVYFFVYFMTPRCDLTTMECVPFLQLRDRGYVSIPISKPGLVQLNPQEETLVEKIHSTTGQSQQTSPKEHTGLTGL